MQIEESDTVMPEVLSRFRDMLNEMAIDGDIMAGSNDELRAEFELAIAVMVVGFRTYRTAVIVAGGAKIRIDQPELDPSKVS